MKFVFVYVTVGNKKEAEKIGQKIVASRLAACINIIPGMKSMYWWKGKIGSAREVVLIAKTRGSLVPRLVKKIRSLHSYSCPCIVSLPILGGNKDFLRWIEQETRKTP